MKTYGIRMLNNEEVAIGSIDNNLCSWFVLIDDNMPLLKQIPQMQTYNKNNNYCIIEVDRDMLEKGIYTLGNESIMRKHNSTGSTGIANHGRFFSISRDDKDKIIKSIKYDNFSGVWQDLFNKVKDIGIPLGI